MTSAFLDVKVKHDYTFNKTVFLTAIIEEYRAQSGSYPETLDQVEAEFERFAAEHCDFADTYLASPWQETKIDWFRNATGGRFWYFREGSEGKYFLYTSYGTVADTPLQQSVLDELKTGHSKLGRGEVYLVYGGDLIWGPCSDVHGITIKNMTKIMHPIVYKGHRPYF
jgi:hypothetical protein